MVVTPHLLQYTLESSNFRVSLEMAAQSLAAGGVNVGRASRVIVLYDIVDSGKPNFTSSHAHDGLDASSPEIHLKSDWLRQVVDCDKCIRKNIS